MKPVALILMSCAALSACNEDKTEVVAGDVRMTTVSAGVRKFSAAFEIRKTDNDRAVINARTGGACLVAHLPKPAANGFNTAPQTAPADECNTDSQCDMVPDPAQPGKRFHGYCMPDNPDLQGSPKRCWVKPIDAASPIDKYCKKQVGLGPWATEPVEPVEINQYVAATAPGRPVEWRVNACLNGPGTGLPQCAGGDGPMMRDYGKILTAPALGAVGSGELQGGKAPLPRPEGTGGD